jgi:hypothetical protein
MVGVGDKGDGAALGTCILLWLRNRVGVVGIGVCVAVELVVGLVADDGESVAASWGEGEVFGICLSVIGVHSIEQNLVIKGTELY